MTSETMTTQDHTPAQSKVVVDEHLVCALTGKPVIAEEAYWAPPLITTRQLLTTTLQTAIRAPSNLGFILFGEQPNVPYAPDARDQLAARRSAEQLKLLVILLALVALIVAPILMFAMR
jgi:hypothetical protein